MNWSRWRSYLYSLYDALLGDINQIGSRGKYVTGSRQVVVKDYLIELMADVFQLVKHYPRARSAAWVLELTSCSLFPFYCLKLLSNDGDSFALDTAEDSVEARPMEGTFHSRPSKWRRIQLGWEVLRDHLHSHHSDFDIIPWYANHSTQQHSDYLKILLLENSIPYHTQT